MKLLILLLLVCLGTSQTKLNTSLKDTKLIADGVDYNDVWGFVRNGKNYIIEGKLLGFIIYEIASNGSATKILYEHSADNGRSTSWGEYRYYKGYVFSSSEYRNKCKIFKIDWDKKTSTYITTFGQAGMHNITIYKDWILTCHSDYGVNCYDLSMNPEKPKFKWSYEGHVHDLVVQNDLMYLAEGNKNTSFSVYNISNVLGNKVGDSRKVLRFSASSAGYAHQIWPTPDGKYVVTTIEDNQIDHIAFWDISDPNNIRNLWKHQEGKNSIVHNAFIKDNFIHTSYYDRGYIVFDISDKDLIVKIGEYDTDPAHDNWDPPWKGAWGIYPYMKNNLVVVSDIENGMFVVEFQPTRAGKKIIRIIDSKTNTVITDKSILLSVSNIKNVGYKELSAGNYLFKGTPNEEYKLSISIEGYEDNVETLRFVENENKALNIKMIKPNNLSSSHVFYSPEPSLRKHLTVLLNFDYKPDNLLVKNGNKFITTKLHEASTNLYKFTYIASETEKEVSFKIKYDKQIITLSHSF